MGAKEDLKTELVFVADSAEAAFWGIVAAALRPRGITCGDLPPDAAASFTAACQSAVEIWYESNRPAMDGEPKPFDGAAFVASLPTIQEDGSRMHTAHVTPYPVYGAWWAAWEHPGFVAWHSHKNPYSIAATPDPVEGTIQVEITYNGDALELDCLELEYDNSRPDIVEGYLAAMLPVLARYREKPILELARGVGRHGRGHHDDLAQLAHDTLVQLTYVRPEILADYVKTSGNTDWVWLEENLSLAVDPGPGEQRRYPDVYGTYEAAFAIVVAYIRLTHPNVEPPTWFQICVPQWKSVRAPLAPARETPEESWKSLEDMPDGD